MLLEFFFKFHHFATLCFMLTLNLKNGWHTVLGLAFGESKICCHSEKSPIMDAYIVQPTLKGT